MAEIESETAAHDAHVAWRNANAERITHKTWCAYPGEVTDDGTRCTWCGAADHDTHTETEDTR